MTNQNSYTALQTCKKCWKPLEKARTRPNGKTLCNLCIKKREHLRWIKKKKLARTPKTLQNK